MLPIYEALKWQSSTVDNVKIDTVEGQINALREIHPIKPGFRLVREKIKTTTPLHYLELETTDYIGVCFVFADSHTDINDLAYKQLYHDNLNITNGFRFSEQTLRVTGQHLYYVSLQFDDDFVNQLAEKQKLPYWLSHLIKYPDDQILDKVEIPSQIRQLAWQACRLPKTRQFSDTLQMQARALQWLGSILDLDQTTNDKSNFATESVFDEQNRAKKFVADTCDIIHKQYAQPLTIKSLATQVGTNECYLKQYFKSYMGSSIHDYLTQYRLDKAKTMLTNYPTLKVRVIAELCGYHASHFSQLFKNTYGLTPSQYREKIFK